MTNNYIIIFNISFERRLSTNEIWFSLVGDSYPFTGVVIHNTFVWDSRTLIKHVILKLKESHKTMIVIFTVIDKQSNFLLILLWALSDLK